MQGGLLFIRIFSNSSLFFASRKFYSHYNERMELNSESCNAARKAGGKPNRMYYVGLSRESVNRKKGAEDEKHHGDYVRIVDILFFLAFFTRYIMNIV